VGPAAHGFDGQIRRWNARHYAEWRDVAMSGVDPREGEEVLTSANRVAERVYLGLRSDAGLALEPGDGHLTERWVGAGWAELGSDGYLRCTPAGWLRLDALAAALTHHRSR
jgi:oxygen-independent coproporphyrinogen-3 oxidase